MDPLDALVDCLEEKFPELWMIEDQEEEDIWDSWDDFKANCLED